MFLHLRTSQESGDAHDGVDFSSSLDSLTNQTIKTRVGRLRMGEIPLGVKAQAEVSQNR